MSFFEDFFSIWGVGGTLANSNLTSDTKFFLMGWGLHQPEPKCHLDLKSNYFIGGGGGVTWPTQI